MPRRVAWPLSDGKAEMGLNFPEPRPAFWRVAFPREDWTPKHPEARTASRARLVDKAVLVSPWRSPSSRCPLNGR